MSVNSQNFKKIISDAFCQFLVHWRVGEQNQAFQSNYISHNTLLKRYHTKLEDWIVFSSVIDCIISIIILTESQHQENIKSSYIYFSISENNYE